MCFAAAGDGFWEGVAYRRFAILAPAKTAIRPSVTLAVMFEMLVRV